MSDHLSKGPAGSVVPSGESTSLPVPRPDLTVTRQDDSWLTRALRTLFGWKPGTIRSDLSEILAASRGETGFSPLESTMLRGILGLRERRVEDLGIGVTHHHRQ